MSDIKSYIVRVNRTLGYSIRRYYVDEFLHRRANSLAGHGRTLLDLGGQKTNKRGFFDINRYAFRVTCLNISAAKGADLLGDAHTLPFADRSFDVALCSELLEHVYQPAVVLREVWRVLRPDGRLLITVPFLFHIHADPSDYGRYTHHYWRALLADIGFANLEIEAQGGFYSVCLNMAEQYLNQIRLARPFNRPFRWFAFHFGVAPLKKWALWWEQRAAVSQNPFLASYTTGYGIVGIKRG